MRFLHFGDRPDFIGDRLGKVRLLIYHLNDTMAELYVPGKDLSVDESMMLFRGRLVFRQFIKIKDTSMVLNIMNYVPVMDLF